MGFFYFYRCFVDVYVFLWFLYMLGVFEFIPSTVNPVLFVSGCVGAKPRKHHMKTNAFVIVFMVVVGFALFFLNSSAYYLKAAQYIVNSFWDMQFSQP